MHRSFHVALIACAVILLCVGCTKTYLVTQPLETPLATPPTCSIGEFADGLPLDMPPEDKPDLEHIQKFREFIFNSLQKEGCVEVFEGDAQHGTYEVNGTILEFKRGSGFLRFLFGAFAGTGELTVFMQLVDVKTKDQVFAGNFTEKVTSYMESGDKTFERIAQKFAKELRKQQEKLVPKG